MVFAVMCSSSRRAIRPLSGRYSRGIDVPTGPRAKVPGTLTPTVPESDDPRVIRSIAVTAEDLVTAYEASERAGRDAVLRVTPPFSGRMRARLHAADVVGTEAIDREGGDGPAPVEIPPETLLAEDVPPYPDPDDTEDELRADPEIEYTRGHHRERHQHAVDQWRTEVRTCILETATVEMSAGPHEIDVVVLGE